MGIIHYLKIQSNEKLDTMSHLVHKYPLYPVSHSTGLSSSGLYPPLQDCGLGHSITSVELPSSLQYSSDTTVCDPPRHTALFMQLLHSVEFHVNE